MITQESSVEIHVVSFAEPPERLDLLENKILVVTLSRCSKSPILFCLAIKNIDDREIERKKSNNTYDGRFEIF